MQHRICNRYHTYFPFNTHTCSFAGVLFGNKISCSKWTSKKSGGKKWRVNEMYGAKNIVCTTFTFFYCFQASKQQHFTVIFNVLQVSSFALFSTCQRISTSSNGTFRSCYFSLHFSSEYQMRHEKWQQESIRVKIVIFAETNNTVREQKTRRWKKNWQREWS